VGRLLNKIRIDTPCVNKLSTQTEVLILCMGTSLVKNIALVHARISSTNSGFSYNSSSMMMIIITIITVITLMMVIIIIE
jgi:hypothetical protein